MKAFVFLILPLVVWSLSITTPPSSVLFENQGKIAGVINMAHLVVPVDLAKIVNIPKIIAN